MSQCRVWRKSLRRCRGGGESLRRYCGLCLFVYHDDGCGEQSGRWLTSNQYQGKEYKADVFGHKGPPNDKQIISKRPNQVGSHRLVVQQIMASAVLSPKLMQTSGREL